MAVKPGWLKWKTPIIIGSVVILLFLAVIVIAALADEPTPVPDIAQTETQASGETTPAATGIENDQSLPTAWQGLKELNEPGFGFTMNYPASWSYTVEEEGVFVFQGAEGSDDSYNVVLVVIISRFLDEGAYGTFADVYNHFEASIKTKNGEIYHSEEVSLQLGNLKHRALLLLARYDTNVGRVEDTILIIERDSDYFYQLSYSAPPEVSKKYNDLVLENIINSFRFTDF
jgi:hypothetical protein